MYNPILEKRRGIIDNIQKSFEPDEYGIEKAKWQIGEVRVDSRGIAHECYEYTADGKPRLRRVKKNKGSAASTDDGKKKISQKKKEKKGQSENKFIPKHSFKDTRNMSYNMIKYLDDVNIQKFVDILGETVYDKGDGTDGRDMRTSMGNKNEEDFFIRIYLQKDNYGDFLEFKKKPRKEKLDECAKILKEQLAKEGYDVNPEFVVLPHNPYFQHSNTFGVGVNIEVTKKDWQNSSKQQDKKKERQIKELNSTKANLGGRGFYDFNCSLVDAVIMSATVNNNMKARNWGSNFKLIRIDRIGNKKTDIYIEERDITTIPGAEKAIRKKVLEEIEA